MQASSEYSLKATWRAKGGSKNSELAAWMNMVANQFNNAEVPSGGTCRPTSNGLRIEVDSASPRSFEVVSTGSTGGAGDWSVRAGIAVDHAGREYWNANGKSPYTLVEMGDIPANPFNFSVWARIDKSAEGVARILFTTLEGTSTEVLQYVLLAEVVDDVVTQLQVGNIFMGEHLDVISLDWNSAKKTQILDWETAYDSTATPSTSALFPYRTSDGALKYSSPEDVAGHINWGTVDWSDFWDSVIWVDTGTDKIPHNKLKFTDTTAEVAAQNADHDQRYPVRGKTFTSWVAQSIGYGSGDNPAAQILQIDLDNGRLQSKDGTEKRADWHTGELFGVGGTTSHLDWLNRELEGGVWTVTDTTAGATGVGALVVAGGISAAAGVWAVSGASAAAGVFDGGAFTATLASNDRAGSFVNATGIFSVSVCGATYALDCLGGVNVAASSAYHHNGVQGITGDGFAGGIKTDVAGFDAHVESIFLDLSNGGF